MKKIARQELEIKNASDECEKNERLEKVSNLRRKFAVARAEKVMVDLGEMMSCLDITMMKELEVEGVNEYMEYECWDDAERMEHEELDTWWKEQPGLVDITMMEDEDVQVMDMESEHDFLDAVMERLSLMEGMVGWEEPLDDKLCTGRSRKIHM